MEATAQRRSELSALEVIVHGPQFRTRVGGRAFVCLLRRSLSTSIGGEDVLTLLQVAHVMLASSARGKADWLFEAKVVSALVSGQDQAFMPNERLHSGLRARSHPERALFTSISHASCVGIWLALPAAQSRCRKCLALGRSLQLRSRCAALFLKLVLEKPSSLLLLLDLRFQRQTYFRMPLNADSLYTVDITHVAVLPSSPFVKS